TRPVLTVGRGPLQGDAGPDAVRPGFDAERHVSGAALDEGVHLLVMLAAAEHGLIRNGIPDTAVGRPPHESVVPDTAGGEEPELRGGRLVAVHRRPRRMDGSVDGRFRPR